MKSVKINIPKGYIVDEKNSTFEEIKFKKGGEITDRIKSLDDAIEELGEYDAEVQTLRQLELIDNPPVRLYNTQKLVVIIKALNEGWIPSFDNGEYKYFPYFDMRNEAFVFDCVNYWYSVASVPAPLLFKNRELAKYTASLFLNIYKLVFSM